MENTTAGLALAAHAQSRAALTMVVELVMQLSKDEPFDLQHFAQQIELVGTAFAEASPQAPASAPYAELLQALAASFRAGKRPVMH